MGITLRSSKPLNTPLTWTETDDNFSYLLTNVSGSNVKIVGATVLTGSLVVSGSATSVTVAGTASLQHVIPQLSNTYNLGSSTFKWNTIFANSISGSFTGSVSGSVSNATSASYAATASIATSSSYALSSSFTTTSSYVISLRASGSDTQVQYNNGSFLAGNSYFTYDYNKKSLALGAGGGGIPSATGTGSIAAGFIDTQGNSNFIIASGRGAVAYGYALDASPWFGVGAIIRASGDGAFAHGYAGDSNFISASGAGSHAEGTGTTSRGIGSHAEGQGCTSYGDYSHAEGIFTVASGSHSHAEGNRTKTLGIGAHAEGYFTTASFNYSHAEGYYTQTNVVGQTAMGQYNTNNNTDALLVVGGGISTSERRDVFDVRTDSNMSGSIMVPVNVGNPSNPTSGSMWIDTANSKIWVYNGTAWKFANLS
jgi:hypothetical protein